MQQLTKIAALRRCVRDWRQLGQSVALVPTMGNLHVGHLQLVKQAKTLADKVVVSIFVNPAQFVAGEDFDTYPRTIEDDVAHLGVIGPDLIFSPEVDEVYPAGNSPDITAELRIPVIGIGAGVDCDGQVLVIYDILGISGRQPKLSKNFLEVTSSIQDAIKSYVTAVKSGEFPAIEHQFS